MDSHAPVLRVLTLNCWGLKYLAKAREIRIRAIAERLYESDYDIVALQEIWVESEDWKMLRERCRSKFPHSKFFYSGAFGSGLAILTRDPIIDTATHPYTLNGLPIHVQNGDWFVGKGCGSVTLQHPVLGEVDVWNTHTVAAGGEDGPEFRRAHRISQAYELAKLCAQSARLGRHVICVGDLNSTPASLPIAMLRTVGGLSDAFLSTHDALPALALTLPGDAASPTDPRRSLRELGVSCDSPINTWTAGKSLDARARRAAGKRLDYILYRAPETENKGVTQLAPSHCEVVFTELIPGTNMSYSDHFGVEAHFSLTSTEAPARRRVDAALQGSVATRQTLTLSMSALSTAMRQARHVQRFHLLIFLGSLGVAMLLILSSALLSGPGVGRACLRALLTFATVAAAWAGTTMLYSAVIWGEWERRALRTFLEQFELDIIRLDSAARAVAVGVAHDGVGSAPVGNLI